MRHEKIFTRQDGSKVKITASIGVETHRDDVDWRVSVSTCAPRKRTWQNTIDTDSHSYRNTPFNSKERDAFVLAKHLEHCTTDEIHEVKVELWRLLEPKR